MAETQVATDISAWNVIVIIIYLVVILLAAYYLTKYIAKKNLQKGMKKPPLRGRTYAKSDPIGKKVSVMDRIPIDRDKTMMVVEFEKHYYLIGVTGQDFKLIDKTEISKEEWESRAAEALAREEEERIRKEQPPQDAESFGQKFAKNFKTVAHNYFKKDSTQPFSSHLEKEMEKPAEKKTEEQDGGKNDLE